MVSYSRSRLLLLLRGLHCSLRPSLYLNSRSCSSHNASASARASAAPVEESKSVDPEPAISSQEELNELNWLLASHSEKELKNVLKMSIVPVKLLRDHGPKFHSFEEVAKVSTRLRNEKTLHKVRGRLHQLIRLKAKRLQDYQALGWVPVPKSILKMGMNDRWAYFLLEHFGGWGIGHSYFIGVGKIGPSGLGL